jgi:iron(II)-dependent oxidoreductase
MAHALETQPAPASADGTRELESVLAALRDARERTLALVESLSDGDLERSHSTIMSPLVWDLAHIAAYEDLWVAQRLCGLELLRGDLAERYDAFETPRPLRAEIEILDAPAAREYMRSVRARAAAALERHGTGEGSVCEMVIRHELQHTETMRQTLAIAGLLPSGEPALTPISRAPEWVRIEAGGFEMGAGEQGFSYDNERPRHRVELGAFEIAPSPVSNASWIEFSEQGGYERRECWSAPGWEWKTQDGVGPHAAIAAGDPRAAACHVSFFEAEAFARAHGARLPSEAEWEKAARSGEAYEPTSGSAGALSHVGQVWEWTNSGFGGYPGFRAYPYREYSEVFFGESYRVLRGSSWATAPRVASLTFRNWDLPQRRQIFAGLRLARDAT